VDRLVAYNERTGQKKPIELPSATVDSATVMDGTVYYDERASNSAQTGQVVALELSTGSTDVAWQGEFPHAEDPSGSLETSLQTLAGGVYLGTPGSKTALLVAPRSLPKAVAATMTPDIRESLLVSNGTAYAWLGGHSLPLSNLLYFWSPGMSTPAQLTLGGGFPELIGGDNGTARFGIAGHWLFTSLQRPTVVDLSTGAMITLPGRATSYFLLGGNLVGVPPGASRLTRLPLTGAPDLHC
jgi:hypothetical protein